MALAEGVPALTTSAARVDAEGRSAEDAVEVEVRRRRSLMGECIRRQGPQRGNTSPPRAFHTPRGEGESLADDQARAVDRQPPTRYSAAMRVAIMGQAAFGEAVLKRLQDEGVDIAGVAAPQPKDLSRPDPLWAAAEGTWTALVTRRR